MNYDLRQEGIERLPGEENGSKWTEAGERSLEKGADACQA